MFHIIFLLFKFNFFMTLALEFLYNFSTASVSGTKKTSERAHCLSPHIYGPLNRCGGSWFTWVIDLLWVFCKKRSVVGPRKHFLILFRTETVIVRLSCSLDFEFVVSAIKVWIGNVAGPARMWTLGSLDSMTKEMSTVVFPQQIALQSDVRLAE